MQNKNWFCKLKLCQDQHIIVLQVIAESDLGLLFKNKVDRKVINVSSFRENKLAPNVHD